MSIFYGFSFSGSFTHQFPTDLEVTCDYDIWGFLQLWAPLRTGEGHRQKWGESEGNGPRDKHPAGRTEHSVRLAGMVRIAADGFAVLAPVQCLPSMPTAMVNGKVTCVFLGADPSFIRQKPSLVGK